MRQNAAPAITISEARVEYGGARSGCILRSLDRSAPRRKQADERRDAREPAALDDLEIVDEHVVRMHAPNKDIGIPRVAYLGYADRPGVTRH